MGAIYQLLFFLSVALLATVVTLFVLAVSLLGRAVRLSAEEQTNTEQKRKQDTEDKIAGMKSQLDQATADEQLDTGDLEKTLHDLKRKDAKHKWKLRWIKMKPKLLTASWGALIPGAFFLISVIFSAIALYLQDGEPVVSPYMWIAVAALGIGICFICLTLRVIEGVAITSEETGLVRDTEAFKSALREIEEEKKPKLSLIFRKEQPPFNLEVGEQISIPFELMLTQGDIARKPRVYFFAPSGFDFTDMATWVQDEYIAKVPEYITTSIEAAECRLGIYITSTVDIKAPTSEGEYVLFYRLTCEGFTTDLIEFNVIVKKKEIPF